ncbi:MAG: tetratricopeptide repeat protein [Vicinamibacterales bacterium]
MTSNKLSRPWVAGPTIAVLVAVIVVVQVVRDRQYPQATVSDRLLYVRSGEALRRLVLSFDALAADVYWIRAIQHFGGERLSTTARNYDLLYPLLDLTTSLDPHFSVAYRFGSIFLSEPYPGGAGRPDLAITLLEKGIKEDGRWQFFHDIAFVHYWHTGNYTLAAEWFQRAATQPGAPYWLAPLAAATLAQGGQRAASRLLWQHLRQTSDNDFIKSSAERRLVQLDVLDFIDGVEPILEKYAQANPEGPLTWERLLADGVVRRIPLDPTGVPFELNPWWGTLTVPPKSSLYPMPSEPPPIVQGRP